MEEGTKMMVKFLDFDLLGHWQIAHMLGIYPCL